MLSGKRLTRVDGFGEMRAVAHAMSIIKDFEFFRPLEGVHWQPLLQTESRELEGGQYVIKDQLTGVTKPQVPNNVNLSHQPVLTSVSDQGGINRSFLDYIVYQVRLSFVVLFDFQHRLWNDVKAAMKAAKIFRSFLSFALLWNINYGPRGSKGWFRKKIAAAAELQTSQHYGPHSEAFQNYLFHIA